MLCCFSKPNKKMTESTATKYFTHPVLTPMASDTRPTAVSLKLLHKEVNANAMSVPSSRGSGQHGHLFLCVSAATYNTITEADFDAPTNPGPAPEELEDGTQFQISEHLRQYEADKKEYNLCINTSSSLRTQILAAVPDAYTTVLSNDVHNLGYANVTPLAILNHLDATYGTVSPALLKANRKAMGVVWNPDIPLSCSSHRSNIAEPLPLSMMPSLTSLPLTLP